MYARIKLIEHITIYQGKCLSETISRTEVLPHPTLAPAFPVVLLSSCPPVSWLEKKLRNSEVQVEAVMYK